MIQLLISLMVFVTATIVLFFTSWAEGQLAQTPAKVVTPPVRSGDPLAQHLP